MNCNPTPLATQIMANIYAQSRRTVFLAVQGDGPRLSFGSNRTSMVKYHICLKSGDRNFNLTSNDTQQFALLIDGYGPQNTPRLVLYMGDGPDPALEYSRSDSKEPEPSGHISITAYEESGRGSAIIHAVFRREHGASLLIDGGEVLRRHLKLCDSLMKGGV